MKKFELEKSMFKRKMLFILLAVMNETMIYFMGDKDFLDYKISFIGNITRIILVVLVVFSVLVYLKEKAIKVEVK